ncbi:MAG: MFS transporter [Bacteroidetes bacterium]|nr:MFS transporter [Bacteroidota bacterium]
MENDMIMSEENVTVIEAGLTSAKAKNNLFAVFTVCFISTLFGGVVTMLMSVYLPIAVKDLLGNVSDEKMNDVSATINSLFIFGWMFGGMAWGIICDKIGRSKSVMLSTACYGLFTLVTAISPNWMLVSISRCMSGFGIGGVLVTTTILISEIWPEKKRAIALGILSIGIPVGFFVAGAINNLLTSWRQAFMTGIIPLAVAIISFFVLKESEKWEIDKQQDDQKEKPGKRLFAEEYRKNVLSGSVIFGAMLIGLWAIFSWAPTWVQSISAPQDAQQLRGLVVMIMASGGLAGSFISGWIANAIGLRKTMMMCFVVCFVMTFVLFKLSTSVTALTYIELSVLAFFFGISQGALAVYIPLLFPVSVRAAATGFCFNVGRLFTGTVVFFIGALVVFLGGYGNAVFIFSFIFLIGLAATYFSKEGEVIKN